MFQDIFRASIFLLLLVPVIAHGNPDDRLARYLEELKVFNQQGGNRSQGLLESALQDFTRVKYPKGQGEILLKIGDSYLQKANFPLLIMRTKML